MLFSLIIRNFKTYQNIHYIALSNSKNFSALVGENGAGKSSILEALDSFFNAADWNFNHTLYRGFQEREPFICPLFLIAKDKLPKQKHDWLIEGLNKITWAVSSNDFHTSGKNHAELFVQQRQLLKSFDVSTDTHYLFPLGLIKTSRTAAPTPYFSIFETLPEFASLQKYTAYPEALDELIRTIHNYYSYIYLPSELDLREHTKLESQTIQSLLGQKIDKIVKGLIDKAVIADLNLKLSSYLDDISEKLVNYEYRKPGLKQSLVNTSHFTSTIIESYFGSKVLNKRNSKTSTVPVSSLSSGEKRQALIDVAQAFLLSSYGQDEKHIILAIDEPELSLHVSACFDQFEKLRKVAETGVQVLITTHWYGFMPILSDGAAIYCPMGDSEPVILDLRCFREEIKKLKTATSGRLPTEFELKGVNDLVQSIVASITAGSYSWIICEGSSDKIYLDFYTKGKYLVVAVGGSTPLKKIYSYLELALYESKDDIKGKVFFLLDTDKKYERFEPRHDLKKIAIKRLKNNERTLTTELLATSDNDFHPATEIEDTLVPSYYLKTLQSFSTDEHIGKEIGNLLPFGNSRGEEMPPSFAYDLGRFQLRTLDDIFDSAGFKVKFALKYISISDPDSPPKWITELDSFFLTRKSNSAPKTRRR